ncbi:MAG: phosphate ABC transporter permease PstA [Bdellovibrionales bacterium]|nr:phosphate ABC transporter permease PstA [Bdellovibrionales bacterium]
MSDSHFFDSWRKFKSRIAMVALFLGCIFAVIPLFAILLHLIRQGATAIDWNFFTQVQKPVGEVGGGMAHAIVGTLSQVGIASLFGIPLGLACGVYLSEYGKRERLAGFVRFALELLASTPSILVGVFVYGILVVPMKKFSLFSGAMALMLILLPLVARTSEELLKLIPQHLREAGLALGIPRWRVILSVVLRSAWPGVLAAILLGVARIAGETAPLVLTSFGNPNFPQGITQPSASLPLQIYTYAISPFEEWHRMAWAGALLLVLSVLALNAITRLSGGSHGRRNVE